MAGTNDTLEGKYVLVVANGIHTYGTVLDNHSTAFMVIETEAGDVWIARNKIERIEVKEPA